MGAVAEAFDERDLLYCGSVYPGAATFEGCETALCLFCAEWLGRQDAYWIAQHGMTGTCVDLSGEKLERMAELYPVGWEFHTADVYDFTAEALKSGAQWDVLTLDPWTGQFERCADLLPTWTTLARKVVVLGHGNYRLPVPPAPSGWTHSLSIKRSDFKGGIYWLVYTRQ